MRWQHFVLGLVLIALAVAVWGYRATSASQGGNGALAIDCNATTAGLQSDCAYSLGTTFRINVVATKAPTDGYFAFQAKVRWAAAQLDYQPMTSAAQEALWSHCTIPARFLNEPADPSVLHSCVPLPWLDTGDTSTGALLQFDFTCMQNGHASLELVPLAGDAQLGTHFVNQAAQAFAPALANANVLCGTKLTATPCAAGGCPTPTPTTTSTPDYPTPTHRPTSTPLATATPTPPGSPGDLAITKSDSPDPVVTGQTLTYTIVVTNVGGQTLGVSTDPQRDPIEVRDEPPANFTYAGFSATLGGSCLILSAPGSPLVCQFDNIDGGESAVITVTGRITTAADIVATNEVWVDLPISHIQESVEVANNTASAETTVLLIAPTPCPPSVCTPTPTVTASATATRTPTPTATRTATPTLPPANTPTPTSTTPAPPGDTDGDGCFDWQEEGDDPAQGGQRDPLSFWDFFDVPSGAALERDRAVTAADIAAIGARFGSSDTGPGAFNRTSDPLSTPSSPIQPAGGRQNYHPAYDRGGVMAGQPIRWLLPPDGSISAGDLAAGVAQFGDSCIASI